MSEFVPPGYKRITDVRKELGHEGLRQQLATGQRAAYYWNRRDAEKPLREIPKNQWLTDVADRLISRGKAIWEPHPFAPKWQQRDLVILVSDAKSNVTRLRAVKGGRPPAADWPAIEELIRQEIESLGYPEHGIKDWQSQSDVERRAAIWLQERNESASESTIRDHVREILGKLRPKT